MANGHTITNGRPVNGIVQLVIAVSAPLLTAGIIGLVLLALDLREEVQGLNSKIDLQIQAAQYEHADFDRRITSFERKRNSERDDSRD